MCKKTAPLSVLSFFIVSMLIIIINFGLTSATTRTTLKNTTTSARETSLDVLQSAGEGLLDVFTQYPAPLGGQGKNNPSDMFWPQKEMILYADVSYSGWPEQNKEVAFEVIFSNGSRCGLWFNRTDQYGIASVGVRLPWPCNDPESIFGEWTVVATTDVAGVVVNDTLTFKYDYKVNLWNVETDELSYEYGENIIIEASFGSYAMQRYSIIFTFAILDSVGVPFGYAYVTTTIGGAEYSLYKNGTLQLSLNVVKWARLGMGTIYVGALNGLPWEGGSAETPVFGLPVLILID